MLPMLLPEPKLRSSGFLSCRSASLDFSQVHRSAWHARVVAEQR